MKKQTLIFLLLFSFVLNVSAQKPPKPSETEANLRKHVGYLASETMGGRRTGEAGATSAAGYVANMFAQYKLKANIYKAAKGKKNQNFLQSFPYISGVAMADSGNTFSLDVAKNDGQRMTFDDKMGFKPLGFSPNGEITGAGIVFAGYGIESAESNYNDYKNTDVRGKVVVVYDGTPDSGNPHGAFGRFNVHAKAKIVKDKGALGLLVIAREAVLENDPLARLEYNQTIGEASLPTLVISRKTAADIFGTSEAKVGEIEKILAANTDSAFRVIVEINSKAIVGFKVNLVRKQTDAYNVIGILEGNDAQLKNEAIVIGAHYDHLGRGGQGSLAANSKEIHHGADDNASGTSALIELARTFAKEKKNKRTIIFIAFGGEEEGLLGSKHYVNNPIFPLDKTVAMINLDMVGRLNDEKLTIGGIGTAENWKSLVEGKNFQLGAQTQVVAANMPPTQTVKNEGVAGTAVNVALTKTPYFNLQLSEDGFGPSDHASFYGKQIPVLFFFTGTHADYHKPSDTAEKINYGGLLRITNYVAEIVRAVDQNQTKPVYKQAQSLGTMGGRRGFNVSLGTIPSYGDSNDGLLLDGVRENSPAAKAGLKAGDKIVRLAGRDVKNVQDYTFLLGELKANEEYEIVVMRGTERLSLKIVPAPAARR